MLRRLPQELAFEDVRQIHLLLLFFKNCKETQEKIKALYTKALSTPALKVVPKVDEPGKFIFSCSIAGVEFKEALCDSERLVLLIYLLLTLHKLFHFLPLKICDFVLISVSLI